MKHAQPLSMLLMLTAAAGLAIAEPTKSDTSDQDLLRGPNVKETDSQPANKDQRPQMSVDEHLEAKPMEIREVYSAIRILSGDRASADVQLNEFQQDKIKEIMQQYREDIRAYQEENRTEMRALRDQMNKEAKERREQRQKAAESEVGGSMQERARQSRDQGETPAARKLRELINNSPAAKNAMKSIKSTLRAEQMDALKEAVVKARVRAESRARDGERGDRAQPARRGMDGDDARPQRRERNQNRDCNGDEKREKPIDD